MRANSALRARRPTLLAVGSPRAYDDDDDVPLVARVDAGATRDRAHATVAADAHPDATIVPGLEAEPSTALARQRRGCVCHCPARDRPTLPRHEDGSPNPATPFRSNAAISLAGEQSSWNSAQEIKKKPERAERQRELHRWAWEEITFLRFINIVESIS